MSNVKERSGNVVYNLASKIKPYQILTKPVSKYPLLEKLTKYAKQLNNRRKIMDYLKDLENYDVSNSIMFAILVRYANAKLKQKKQQPNLYINPSNCCHPFLRGSALFP